MADLLLSRAYDVSLMRRFAVRALAASAVMSAVLWAADSDVQLSDDSTSVTVSNEELALRIDKQSARLRSLSCQGRELLGPGQGYVQIAGDHSAAVRWEF